MVGLSQCIFYLFEPQLIFLFRYLFLLNLQEMIGDNPGNETIHLVLKYRTTAERKKKRKEKKRERSQSNICRNLWKSGSHLVSDSQILFPALKAAQNEHL